MSLHCFLEFALLFPSFPNKNCHVKKIWNQKNMLVGGKGAWGGGRGESNYLNQKFHQIKMFLLLGM